MFDHTFALAEPGGRTCRTGRRFRTRWRYNAGAQADGRRERPKGERSAMAALRETQGARSALDPDHVYERLQAPVARVFRLLTVHPGPDVSVGAVAVLADLPVNEAQGALACLAEMKLAEDVAGSTHRWRLADMARPHAERLADKFAEADGRKQARNRLFDYYLIATEAADNHLRGQPPIPVPQEFSDQRGALAWLDAERASLIAAVEAAAAIGRCHAAKSLPLLLAYYLGFRGRFDELLAMSTISLTAAQQLKDQAAEGDALTNLGLALFGLHRYDEAVVAHQETVAIFREIEDQHGEADALNNLGLALHSLHRESEAADAQSEATDIYRATGDRNGEGNALNNLGLALRAMRQVDQAVAAHSDAAAIFRETGDRHGLALASGNLGNVLQELGQHNAAVAAYQEAADMFRETGDQSRELMAREKLTTLEETL